VDSNRRKESGQQQEKGEWTARFFRAGKEFFDLQAVFFLRIFLIVIRLTPVALCIALCEILIALCEILSASSPCRIAFFSEVTLLDLGSWAKVFWQVLH
jgi:hypothetical protein